MATVVDFLLDLSFAKTIILFILMLTRIRVVPVLLVAISGGVFMSGF